MERIQNIVTRPVLHSRFFFLFTWLMSCTICITGNYEGIETSLFLTALLSVFDIYLLCICKYIFGKIKLGWLVTVATSILLYTELFTIFYNHSFLNQRTLQLIVETNPREGSEFLGAVLLHKESIAAFVITLIVFLLTYLILHFLPFLLSKRFRIRLFLSINGKKIYAVFNFLFRKIALFVFFVIIIWSGIRQAKAYYKICKSFTFAYSFEFGDYSNQPRLVTPFVRFLFGSAYNYVLLNTEADALIQSVSKTSIDSCSYRCPLIIMVIGESYSKHHCQLYYPDGLPTSPRLLAKKTNGNLYPYTDVIAPFNHTAETFRYMFSTWDEFSNRDWAEHTLFTAAFKKAGYNVYYITNQFLPTSESHWDVYGGRMFNYKTLSEMQFTGRNTKGYQFDEDLLSEIPTLEKLVNKPTLLIVHLQGQHSWYAERYPQNFNVFKPEDVYSKYDEEWPRSAIAHYKNATLYNDFVVDSLFNIFKKTDAIALYFSDHGEEVYDWRWRHLRSDEPEITPIIAHYQYEIPFMFYMTDKFMLCHEDIAEEVKAYVNRPFILTDLPNLMFHLGGIKMLDYQEERDLLSEKYDSKRKRLIRRDVDYDVLMKQPWDATE